MPIPEKVALKSHQEFKTIGQGLPRLDTSIKTTGEAVFGMDVQMPGLLNAVVLRAPSIGAKIKSWDANKVTSLPGVRHAIQVDAGIAILVDTFWQAKKAAETVRVEWTEENATLSSDTIREQWIDLAKSQAGRTRYQRGNAKDAMSKAARVIEANYHTPFQAHATPEPMNCTAYVKNGKCEIWAPTQNQDAAQEVAARITGLGYRDIKIHTTFLGGGFGRRILVDYVAEAVQISQAVGKPVKVMWTREDDTRHDFYRPGNYNSLQAGLDANGKLVAWMHKIVGPDYMAEGLQTLFPSMLPYAVPRAVRNIGSSLFNAASTTIIPGAKVIEGANDLPYAIDNIQVDHVNADPGIPKGFWRSVGFSTNTFVVESFLDEVAHETKQDPFKFREQLLANSPRLQNVLRLAAEKANWGKPTSAGVYQGIAAVDFQGAMVSMVAEVSVKSGAVQVHRVVVALDCGTVVNPKLVTAQIEGGIAFGLTAAMKSEITVKDGKVVQSNFHDFQLLRMNEMPKVEVHLVASEQPPLGVGESAVPIIGPTVANAIFAATGKRIRKLPIDPAELAG